MVVCSVRGCKNMVKRRTGLRKRVRFHRFPKDDRLRDLWIKFCDSNRQINCETARICSDHFSADCKVKQLKLMVYPSQHKLLGSNAVPTLAGPLPREQTDQKGFHESSETRLFKIILPEADLFENGKTEEFSKAHNNKRTISEIDLSEVDDNEEYLKISKTGRLEADVDSIYSNDWSEVLHHRNSEEILEKVENRIESTTETNNGEKKNVSSTTPAQVKETHVLDDMILQTEEEDEILLQVLDDLKVTRVVEREELLEQITILLNENKELKQENLNLRIEKNNLLVKLKKYETFIKSYLNNEKLEK